MHGSLTIFDNLRQQLRKFVDQHGWGDRSGRVHWGGLKDFSDGSLGSSTALMHQPYAQDSTSFGLAVQDFGLLGRSILEGHDLGLQVSLSWKLNFIQPCLSGGMHEAVS